MGDLHRHVPGIEGAVRTWELSTPLSTRHFVGAARGQIYGLAHSPERFLSRDLGPRTPIQNLFLTGQDVGTCGVMGALSGAVTPLRPCWDGISSGSPPANEANTRRAA